MLTKPGRHFHFVEFGGDCSGAGCTLPSISAGHTVSATFAEDPEFALSIAKEGGGQALIRSRPGGLQCAGGCSSQAASFYAGEQVELVWKLGRGTDSIAFSGEAGDCPSLSEAPQGSCQVSMDAAHSLVATLE